jgi:O-antigen/teichoic acid export membrane protein
MRATRMGGPARPVAQPRRTPDLALRSLLATNVALAGPGVLTGVPSARLLHPAGEGELAAIQTWPLLPGMLTLLGLDSALIYFFSRARQRQAVTSTAVFIGLLSSLTVGGMVWFVLPFALRAQPPQAVAAARVSLLIGGIYALVGIPAAHCEVSTH